MKNSIKFLTAFILTIAFSLTSCDEVESLADVDFNSSLSGKYNLNFKAETEEEINESLTINLADDSTISEYLNKLKNIEISKITYEIINFSGDNYVDMNVGLYMNKNTIVAPKEYNLSSENGVVYEITDAAILKTISSTLLNSKQVTLKLEGKYASVSAATAEIKVTVYFKATANPL